MSEEDYGSFDDEETAAAITLAATTPARLQQRTLFGGIAQVQVSPGAASYSANRARQRDRNEPRTHHVLNTEALHTWVFPTNYAKRDYQFNMIRKALYTNVLVALPTGLGKTFIAAVVMYNWYRWAPKSKIIFLAPAKPLVTQQIEACYSICGIPAAQMAELTGGILKGRRTAAYNERRVFFLTPQTFRNDLANGLIKAKDISCIVVDEAHHATGNYAYVEVVRQMRQETDSFRLLALTATPGKTVEAVQEVIDALNISQIEIRNESSIDIRSYTHTKEIETILIDLSPEMTSIQTKFGKLLKPMMIKLSSLGAGITQDPTKLSAFAIREATLKLQRESHGGGRQRSSAAFVIGGILSSLAFNMELLNTHGIRPFYDAMVELRTSVKSSNNKKQIIKDPTFSSMMQEMEELLQDPAYTGHPKLDHLSGLILNHFQRAAEDGDKQTRVMIFSSLRVSAEAIVTLLKQHAPLVKPTPFFGQQAGKTGSGMSQKEQQQTIEKFKSGLFNVIVATSVGEEGLDIGEVDMIICYDSSSSPARMLQRMGRTGRKRDGQVFVLCVRGKEEMAFIRAKDAHKVMQKKIERGIDIKLSETVHRIIPWNIDPECEERLLNVPDNDKRSDRDLKTITRSKRQAKVFNMPEGAERGFVTARDLAGTGSKTRRATQKKFNIDEELWNFDQYPSDGLLTTTELFELDKRFRNLDEDHAGCFVNRRAEEGLFLDRGDVRSISKPVLIGNSRTTRMIKLLTLHRFEPTYLEEETMRYQTLTAGGTQASVFESEDEINSTDLVNSQEEEEAEDEDARVSDSDSYAHLGSFIDDSDAETADSRNDHESSDDMFARSSVAGPPIMKMSTKKVARPSARSDPTIQISSSSADTTDSDDPTATSRAGNFEYVAQISGPPGKMRLSQLAKDSDDEELPDTAKAIESAITLSSKKKLPSKRKCMSPRLERSPIQLKRLKVSTPKGRARTKIRIQDDDDDDEW